MSLAKLGLRHIFLFINSYTQDDDSRNSCTL